MTFLRRFGGGTMKYVVMPLSRKYALRSSPRPGSTWKSLFRYFRVAAVMWTRLEYAEKQQNKKQDVRHVATLSNCDKMKSIEKEKIQIKTNRTKTAIHHLPWNSTRFHLVCECHIVAPNIVLPFSKAEYTAQDPSGVDAHPHV